LKDAAGTSDVMQVVANGRGRFPSREESGRPVVWVPTYAIALWEPVVGGREDPQRRLEGWTCTDRTEFVARMLHSVMRLVPSIDAQLQGGNGPSPLPWVSINPGGRCHSYSVEHDDASDIGAKGLAQILDVARSERFFDLPADLGHSIGPDSSMISIRIRTINGSRLVRIHGPVNEARDGASAVDALARAKRVLHAIPHAKDWRVEQL
jgi:hypothetical protein